MLTKGIFCERAQGGDEKLHVNAAGAPLFI
jgi:hypothetical protein